MIEINLLPEEFRIKENASAKVDIPALKLAIGAGVLLVLLTAYFYVDFLLSAGKLKKLEARWREVQPQALVLNRLQSEVEGVLKTERDFLKLFVTNERPLTHTLTWLSEFLPETAWLTEVKMQHNAEASNLVVKGLCLPTKEKSSIEHIEDYLHQLKQRMQDAKLSLTTTRQIKDEIEVTQFVAVFDWSTEDSG